MIQFLDFWLLASQAGAMSTYVLIPGACHGAWCYDDLAQRLRAAGHEVHALTLAGLGEGDSPVGVNLETHIDQVAEVVRGLDDVVLVGHSYGGMVVSGVADRLPEHIDSVVYLDALVPRDGENCWSLVDDAHREWYIGVDETGFAVPPMPFFDPRARAHPLATFLQRIRLRADLSRFRKRVYLYAEDWPSGSPMDESYQRVRDDPSWEVHSMASKHNFMRDIPSELAGILLGVALAESVGKPGGEHAERRR
jgi:pimeloyl-ACP methyl ester carboxylesterase